LGGESAPWTGTWVDVEQRAHRLVARSDEDPSNTESSRWVGGDCVYRRVHIWS